MNRLIVALAVVASGCMPAPETGSTPKSGAVMPASILEPYLEIQDALYRDDVGPVRAKAGAIATAGTALGAPALKLYGAALQLSGAGIDLEASRERFGALSEAIVTYMDGLQLSLP